VVTVWEAEEPQAKAIAAVRTSKRCV